LFGSPPNFWVAALLVPGALSIVLAFASIGENASDKTDAGDGGDAETEEAPDATTPDSGKLYGNATLRFSFIYALYYTVAMLTFMVWMWAGYWLYFRLDEAIFAGETLDGASAVASLSEAWRRLWPIAVALSGVIAVMMFLLTAGGPFLQWISQRGVPDANRDLSSAEAKFIDKSAERVRAYAQAQRYDRNVLAFQGFSLIAVFASSGAVIGLLVLIAGSLAPKTRASFPVVLDSNLSAILWVFVGIFLCPLLHSILTRASRSYSERSGWVAIGEKNDYFTLTGKLTSFVRQRRLSATNEINPGAFLHAANLSFERYFYVPAAVLAAVAAFFSHRDYASADTITAEHFEVVDYWTLEQRRYTYGDVKEVAIRCSFGDKEGTIEGYRLQFDDGSDLDIYDNTKVGDQLAAYTAVDEKLRALGVPFVPAARGGWGRDGEAGFDADCVTQIAKAFPAERADAVRRLFHVETLRAAGQIWPWDAELAAAWLAGDSYDVQTAVALYTKAIASGRLKGHMLAVAYTGRGDAREIYEIHHGVRDAEMLLALRDYQKASTLEPTTSRYRDEALAYAALGAYDEALSAYKKALELDRPKPYWSLIGLARIERARGRYDEALRHLDQVLRVWGEDDVSMALYYQRARVLYLKGDDAGVVEAITKGLAHDAADASALRYRACAQARLGAFAKAKADIAQTIKLAHAPPTDPAWARTPQAAAYYAAFDADRALIDAMAAGTATGDAKAKLCAENWQYRDTPRARSPLLP
jgi:tetratricopeptide (TPR) repeat protein